MVLALQKVYVNQCVHKCKGQFNYISDTCREVPSKPSSHSRGAHSRL